MSLTCSEPLKKAVSAHTRLIPDSPRAPENLAQPSSLLEVYSGLLRPQSLAPHELG